MQKGRMFWLVVVSCIVLSVALAFGCAVPAAAPAPTSAPSPAPAPAPAPVVKLEWKCQLPLDASSDSYKLAFKPFCDRVTEKSGGRLIVTAYPANAIVPPAAVTDSLGKGVFEVAVTQIMNDVGKYPEADVLCGLPFTFAKDAEFYDFVQKYKDQAYLKLAQQVFEEKNIHAINFHASGDWGLMTKFPVAKLDDIKGKKLRTQGMLSPVFKELGAVPTSMNSTEQYQALQLGTIDGIVFPYYTLESYKFKEILNYVVYPPCWTVTGATFAVNNDKWKALPDDLKKVFEEAAVWAANNYEANYAGILSKALDEGRKAGVKEVTLSNAEVLRMKQTAMTAGWDTAAKGAPRSAQFVDLIKGYMKEKGML